MIGEIPVFFAKGKRPIPVELQIRTNGMDFWATLEHQLRYQKGIEEMLGYDEISEELLHSARSIIEADNEMPVSYTHLRVSMKMVMRSVSLIRKKPCWHHRSRMP